MTIHVEFPADRSPIQVYTRDTDNLPQHVKNKAYWIEYDNHAASAYHIEDLGGTEVPIEFINNKWYILHWTNYFYRTCEGWDLPSEFKVGNWRLSDP